MNKILFAACFCLALFPVRSMAQQDAPLHITVPQQGGKACFSQAEIEAEQGLRIHSELMVIALNCQHMTPRGWKNFYQQYQEITARNRPLFAGYERTLINFYSRDGRANPERALHDLRTDLANKVSTDAALMRPDIFCARYAPRLPKVDKMTTADLQSWARTAQGVRPTEKLCH